MRLVAVCTCHARVYPRHDQAARDDGESRAQVVRDTWLKTCTGKIDVRFFYGRGAERTPEPDEVFLDVDDSYYGLPEKVRAICQWARAHGYTELLKIDDDCILWVDRLLSNLPVDEYVGYEIESGGIKYASGAAYWLNSPRAIGLVADANPPEDEWREDLHSGRTLLEHDIKLTHDPRYLCCSCEDCIARYGGLDNLISLHNQHQESIWS